MRPTQKWCLFAMWLLYAAPIVTMMYWASGSQRARGVITVALVAVLVAFIAAVTTLTWKRFFLIQLPLSLLGVGFTCYTVAFNMPPGRTLALIVLLASPEQVLGFLLMPQGALLFGLLTVWCIVYYLLARALSGVWIFDRPMVIVSRIVLVMMLPATAYAALDPAQLIDGIALNPMAGSLMFVGGRLFKENHELHGSRVNKTPYGAHRSGLEEVHVFIIGESARRNSWTVYGYRRPTTPYMDSLRSEAIFFQNARADANLTEWVVPILLTGLSPDTYSVGKIRGNFLDLAHEAGYSTAWLVNNNLGVSNMIGVYPDRLELPPDWRSNINGRHTLDESLLDAFGREIGRSGSSRFIGLHIMGSHWEYYARYPSKFQKFTRQSDLGRETMASVLVDNPQMESLVVDDYDNSLLYTDWFLQQIIEKARALKVPATVSYISDHGEGLQLLDGTAGHGAPAYSSQEFEVPAFVWVNAAYRRMHPDVVHALQANADKEIRSHNFFDSLGQLMGIRWPDADPHKSFASSQYVPDVAMPFIAGGTLVNDPNAPGTRD
jgi:glucan phosphoethanolaminetransferase (alkaline phosphatase superfamily)